MMKRIPRVAGIACALLIATTACASGAGAPPESSPTSAPSESEAPAPDEEAPAPDDGQTFCAVLSDAVPRLGLLVFVDNMDNPAIGEDLARAASVFADASPPAEIADDWKSVADVLGVLAEAFDGVDPTDGDQLRAAQASLDEGIDEQATAAAAAGERITSYAETSCPEADAGTADGAASLSDACELLTAEELRRVFPSDAPAGQGKNFGAGFLECIWTDSNAEVGVAVLPAASLAADYTDRMTPLSTSADLGDLADAQVYAATIGIGRAGGAGHTVVFTRGDQGVMVAVRIGADGSRPADTEAAAELAQAVGEKL